MCYGHAILAPTNAQIDTYNNNICQRLDGHQKTYIASDSLKEVEEAGISDMSPDAILDWISLYAILGLPPNKLTLKTGALCRVMHNISIDCSMVKNARLVIIDIGARVIVARLL